MDAREPDRALKGFLGVSRPVVRETVSWQEGQLRLGLDTFITSCPPPDRLVTSARCIVVREGKVLTVTDRDGIVHIMPGGRRESGESLVETAHREILEETGLHVVGLRQIGVMLYEHLTPCPKEYPYPFPHFMQVVFVTTRAVDGNKICDDEWAASAEFMDVMAVRGSLPGGQQWLLDAAVRAARR